MWRWIRKLITEIGWGETGQACCSLPLRFQAWVTDRVGLSHTETSGGKANWRAVCGIWGQGLCTALRLGLYLPGYNRNKACHQKRWSYILKY